LFSSSSLIFTSRSHSWLFILCFCIDYVCALAFVCIEQGLETWDNNFQTSLQVIGEQWIVLAGQYTGKNKLEFAYQYITHFVAFPGCAIDKNRMLVNGIDYIDPSIEIDNHTFPFNLIIDFYRFQSIRSICIDYINCPYERLK